MSVQCDKCGFEAQTKLDNEGREILVLPLPEEEMRLKCKLGKKAGRRTIMDCEHFDMVTTRLLSRTKPSA